LNTLITPITMAATKFWKVIVIQLDLFESTIIDERHFSNKEEAKTFESKYAKNDSIICVACMM